MRWSLLWALSAIGTACLSNAAVSYVQHEERSAHAYSGNQWTRQSRASAEILLPMRVALKQRNLDHGNNLLMDISDPSSPNFGRHLSPREIGEMFEPHHESIQSVRRWLIDSGIPLTRQVLSRGKGYIKFNATIAEAESLLRTEYYYFRHVETDEQHVATDRYHVPRHVHDHVDFITPTLDRRHVTKYIAKRTDERFVRALPPLPKQSLKHLVANITKFNSSRCSDAVSITCIRAMYGIPVGNSSAPGNQLAVFANEDTYDQEDLDTFFTIYSPKIPNGTHPKLDSIHGGVAPANSTKLAGEESLLDFELTMSLIWPQTAILYQVGSPTRSGSPIFSSDWLLEALDESFCMNKGPNDEPLDSVHSGSMPTKFNHTEKCGTFKPANVISISYGTSETVITPRYARRQCDEYMKLGLAGTSVIYASGDTGVASRDGCFGKDQFPPFQPDFASNCPYVTSVGGTQLPRNATVDAQQEAVLKMSHGLNANYSSGGGFSNYFARPSYQHVAVQNYLTKYAPASPAWTFNRSGRGYPDVSAVGINIVTQVEGEPNLSLGTSASAPIFASIITLINERRIAAGKGPIGFVNPTLYANPSAFNDVVRGYNLQCHGRGFNASEGWDPVTGLGTPNFPKLLSVFMSLP